MTTAFEFTAYETMAAQIVRDVFETMLSYEVCQSSDEYDGNSSIVTSAIFLAGEWKGAVVLECSEQQARFYTSLITGTPPPSHMDDETRDAMGEIINIVGGNLKSVLPSGVSLSVPSVLEGADYAYRICKSNQRLRMSFRGEAGPFWITLVQVADA